MRVGYRWLEARYIAAAIADGEDIDDIALYLVGADVLLARKRGERRLQLVRDGGGEVA